MHTALKAMELQPGSHTRSSVTAEPDGAKTLVPHLQVVKTKQKHSQAPSVQRYAM